MSQLLPIVEHFYTLQGEGAFAGKAAYFIRTAGCDVGCVWCDTKHSWDMQAHQEMSVNKIVKNVLEQHAEIAVITGGEPLMHSLDILTSELQAHSIRTHIETSGAHPLSGKWDWITLSPKKFKLPLPEIIPLANELKIIVFSLHDLQWAETFTNQVSKACKLYLQTEYSKSNEMLPIIIDFIKKNPKWQLSLQTHKILNIP